MNRELKDQRTYKILIFKKLIEDFISLIDPETKHKLYIEYTNGIDEKNTNNLYALSKKMNYQNWSEYILYSTMLGRILNTELTQYLPKVLTFEEIALLCKTGTKQRAEQLTKGAIAKIKHSKNFDILSNFKLSFETRYNCEQIKDVDGEH
jgi:F420-dependent methylenetetrahydromethanopterin dehydrogenase